LADIKQALVADDDGQMVKLVSAVLKEVGVPRILTAKDGQAALGVVEHGQVISVWWSATG
jgi:CheY-like chemotaxis protein